MNIRECIRRGISIYELPLRVCYYARVSTDHDLQVTSIINQVDYFEKYINSISKWSFVGGYVDEGISGKDVRKRENFLRMVEEAKIGKFDLILTKSVSRFARNTVDSIQYTDLLLQYGVGVFFLNDNINTFYSDSEFRLTLMASIAQDELRKLSESVQFGLRQSIQRGVVLGNDSLLGYRKVRGRLEIVEEEAKMVRDIFIWFVTDKYNYREISDKLFDKYGKRLDSTGIRRVLMNYKYKGYYCGGKSRVVDYKKNKRENIDRKDWVVYLDYEKVPPIVEEDVWDKVQVIIEKRHKKYKDGGRSKVYSGKLVCVNHRRVMRHKGKKYKDKEYHYYVCNGCCSLSTLMLDKITSGIKFTTILVIPGEELQLKIKCQ